MRQLTCDTETFSSVDIGKCGSYKYIESPDFEVLLLSYAFDDEPVKLVDLASGEEWPAEFVAALTDPTVVKRAWNSNFDRCVLGRALGIESPIEQWMDDMILAAACGLPLSLKGAGEALKLSADQAKDRRGALLIRYFCVPCKPTEVNGGRTRNLPEHNPEKWQAFKEYSLQDTAAEQTIRRLLEKYTPDETEHRFWCLDQKINDLGIRVDPTVFRNAMAMDARYKAELTEQAVAISGLDNPNSVSQVKEWLAAQEGIEVPSLNKKAVVDLVAKLSTDACKQFMAIRTELSKSSTKKFEAMERCMCADEHIRGCFQFYGARTGRFAGRLVQLQNLAQNHLADLAVAREIVRSGDYETLQLLYRNVTSTLSELIRTALIPEPGHRFIVADFSAIEARVIAWLADETWRIEAFANGKDIYCESASKAFGVPVVKHGINGHLRQKGKVLELACGYGGGVGAMKNFEADKLGMSEEEMAETVALWREASPNIVNLWRGIERAAARAIVRGSEEIICDGRVRFKMKDGILFMTLPSGRPIAYPAARYEVGTGKYTKDKRVVSFMGVDQTTRKWTRIETFGGKLTENLVQSTARDCLREAMLRLDDAGFDIRATVHDEVIITEPIGGRSVEDAVALMCADSGWTAGLPLNADGYECSFYMKD